MVKHFSQMIALFVLAVVLTGVFHDECRHAVLAGTLSGMMVGLAHGFLCIYCVRERSRRGMPLTIYRIKKILVYAFFMDTSIGLLLGVVSAIGSLCRG
jgi:hypothetical protein